MCLNFPTSSEDNKHVYKRHKTINIFLLGHEFTPHGKTEVLY